MTQTKPIKHSGELVFDIGKIENAIRSASQATDYRNALSESRIRIIAAEVADICDANDRAPSTEEIQQAVDHRHELREAAAEVIHSNRRIRDNMRRVAPFYRGDTDTPEPPLNDRLPRHVDPKHNGAYKCVNRLGNALKEIMPGHYPSSALKSLRKTTVSVIHDSIESIHRSTWINKFDTLLDDIHDYLGTPNPHLTHEEPAKAIASAYRTSKSCGRLVLEKSTPETYLVSVALLHWLNYHTRRVQPEREAYRQLAETRRHIAEQCQIERSGNAAEGADVGGEALLAAIECTAEEQLAPLGELL